jgi:hypothetical protein
VDFGFNILMMISDGWWNHKPTQTTMKAKIGQLEILRSSLQGFA